MHTSQWQDKTSWNAFVVEHSTPASFLQSWEWGEFQKAIGNDVLRIGMYPGEFHAQSEQDPFAITTIHNISLPLSKSSYRYIPRGPIINRDKNQYTGETARMILRAISKYNKNSPIFLRINPSWKKTDDVLSLDNYGFTEPEILSRKREPETTLITDISEQDDVLLSRMHQKTRYNIRLATRKNVTTECLSGDRSHIALWNLLQETASREKIRTHDKEYYRILCDIADNPKGSHNNIDHTRLYAMILVARFEGESLAIGLWLGFGNTLTYLYGGSSNKHRNVMAPYKLHWDAMRWGRNHGYTLYDWWGIDGKKSVFNLSGVSRFKQGFGGEVVEFADTKDFVFRPNMLAFLKRLKKLKEIF